MPDGIPTEPNVRCVSLDGDADRLIYYYVDEKKEFHMLDGDKIGTLIAGYIMELVQTSNVGVSLGLVQTAYANGNSTDYINNQLVRIDSDDNFLMVTILMGYFLFRKCLWLASRPG